MDGAVAVIALTAILRCKPESAAQVEAALLDVMRHAQANEPGTIDYFVSKSADESGVLCTYERYTDRAALDLHNASDTVARFFAIARPLMVVAPVVIIGTELAATDRGEEGT